MGWNRKKIGLRSAVSGWRILFWSTLAGMLVMLYTILLIPVQYASQGSIYVSDAAASETILPTGSVSLPENYSQSYLSVIDSEQTYRNLKKELSSGMTTEMLRDCVTVEQVDSTAVFTISVKYQDADSAQMMVNSMVDAAIQTLNSVGVSASQLDEASEPDRPAAPRLLLITLAAMLIVGVVRLLIMLAAAAANRTLGGTADWEATFDIPVLAEIPERDA